MYRKRWMFSIVQDDFQSPVLQILNDVVAIQAGQTATGCSRLRGGADTVDGAPRYELNGSGNGRAFRRDEIPSIETKIAERDDVVLHQIGRFFDGRVFRQILGRPDNDAPDNSAETGSNKGGIWQMPDPYSDVDTLVDEVYEPVEEENCN
jgi:hypothetical protein